MDLFLVALVAAVIAWSAKTRGERERIALLGVQLRPFDIEKLLETLSEGYARALGESDGERQRAIWEHLAPSEQRMAEQFTRFARQFSQVDAERSRVMRPDWPLSALLRLAGRAFPALLQKNSFDMRALVDLHARAIAQAAQRSDLPPKQRAFTMLAELLLMQHSCHWFCKSRPIASARLLLRHQTPYQKVLASVDPETQRAYRALTGVSAS
jgi:hypothetical protein